MGAYLIAAAAKARDPPHNPQPSSAGAAHNLCTSNMCAPARHLSSHIPIGPVLLRCVIHFHREGHKDISLYDYSIKVVLTMSPNGKYGNMFTHPILQFSMFLSFSFIAFS